MPIRVPAKYGPPYHHVVAHDARDRPMCTQMDEDTNEQLTLAGSGSHDQLVALDLENAWLAHQLAIGIHRSRTACAIVELGARDRRTQCCPRLLGGRGIPARHADEHRRIVGLCCSGARRATRALLEHGGEL